MRFLVFLFIILNSLPISNGFNTKIATKLGRVAGVPASFDNATLVNDVDGDFEKCMMICEMDDDCMAVTMEDCSAPCYSFNFGQLSQIIKVEDDTGETSTAIKILTDEPVCEKNIGNLFKSRIYPLPNSSESYLIETAKTGWEINFLNEEKSDIENENGINCNWGYERLNGDQCQPECLLTMVYLYGFPLDSNSNDPLMKNESMTDYEECTKWCHEEKLCYAAYMGKFNKGCSLYTMGQVTMFKKVTSLSGHRFSIKINNNEETCNFSTLQLLNGQMFNSLEEDETVLSYQVKNSDYGYTFFGKVDAESPIVNCPLGWESVPDATERYCIRYVKQPNTTANEAHELCKAAGGGLASPRSKLIIDFTNEIVKQSGGSKYRIGPIETTTDLCEAVNEDGKIFNTECDVPDATIDGFVCTTDEFFYDPTIKQCSWETDRLNGAECRPECAGLTMITVEARSMEAIEDIKTCPECGNDFNKCRKACFETSTCYMAEISNQICTFYSFGQTTYFEKNAGSYLAVKINGNQTTCGLSTEELLNKIYFEVPQPSDFKSYKFKPYILSNVIGWQVLAKLKTSLNNNCYVGFKNISSSNFPICTRVFNFFQSKPLTFEEAAVKCSDLSSVPAQVRTTEDLWNITEVPTTQKLFWVGVHRVSVCSNRKEKPGSYCSTKGGYNLRSTFNLGEVIYILDLPWIERSPEASRNCVAVKILPDRAGFVNLPCDTKAVGGFACSTRRVDLDDVTDPWNDV